MGEGFAPTVKSVSETAPESKTAAKMSQKKIYSCLQFNHRASYIMIIHSLQADCYGLFVSLRSKKKCSKRVSQLLCWCFRPIQPRRIISGLKETFRKRYIVERTNKAEIRPAEQNENTESYRENFWNEIPLKGSQRQKQTQEQNKKEWASSVDSCQRHEL